MIGGKKTNILSDSSSEKSLPGIRHATATLQTQEAPPVPNKQLRSKLRGIKPKKIKLRIPGQKPGLPGGLLFYQIQCMQMQKSQRNEEKY
ncbi:MAG: hypothetical protein L3J84_01885 [Gammaproteobacteria bacterium]|nr:hypothetical protein [Gammaproteobacteria bacterium]